MINGKMIEGAHGITGEIKFLTMSEKDGGGWTQNENGDWIKLEYFDWSKAYDIIAKEIRAGICFIDPKLVCVRCEMMPDLEKLKSKIAEYLPAEYLPKFVYMRDEEMVEYVLLGQMILSLAELERRK